MPMLTAERLGPTQSLTREGFLVCEGVPIARTGVQFYADGELPTLVAGRDGLIRVERPEAEVFSADSMASFESKPVVAYAHPREKLVTPQTSKTYQVGHVRNVRRGEGERAGLLLADLIITDHDAIEKIRSGALRSVSCGYTARYLQTEPGAAVQRGIHGNHVALVPNGRAGVICSIGDVSMSKTSLRQRLLAAFRGNNVDEFQDVLAEVPDAPLPAAVRATIAPTGDEGKEADATVTVEQIDKLAKRIEEMLKKQDEHEGRLSDLEDDFYDEPEKEEKTGDAPAAEEVHRILSMTEVLSPGLEVPTGDDTAKSTKKLVEYQRKAMAMAISSGNGREFVVAALPYGRSVEALTADQVPVVFSAAAEIARRANNSQTASAQRAAQGQARRKSPMTPEEINEANRKFWAKNGA